LGISCIFDGAVITLLSQQINEINFMPITSSAKKALRAGNRKRIVNLRTRAAIDAPLKKFRKLVVAKSHKEATALVSVIYQALDKAVKKNYIKKNAASRTKSRIMAALAKVSK
jgi:ribosomal protein S20